MSATAQVTANIANAQHSSGPRSETRNAASAQDSLKHGLTAKSALLPGEDESRLAASLPNGMRLKSC
jgi:hypothetical protein